MTLRERIGIDLGRKVALEFQGVRSLVSRGQVPSFKGSDPLKEYEPRDLTP